MKLKAEYENFDEIPEKYQDLYEERGNRWILTKIEGIKTEADVVRLQRSLENNRTELKKYKKDIEDLRSEKELLQSEQEMFESKKKKAAAAPDDTESFDSPVVKTIQRENNRLKTDLENAIKQIEVFQGNEKKRTILDQVRDAALKSRVTETALEDVLLLAERKFDVDDNGGVYTNDSMSLNPTEWLKSMETARPHWWPTSSGGNSQSQPSQMRKFSGAENPWGKDGFNLTKQMEILKTDPELATSLQQEAKK